MTKIHQEDIEKWAAGLQAGLRDGSITRHANPETTILVMFGKKYARIVYSYLESNSAYGFIDMETGKIFKSASWAIPAKGARGDMFGENPYAGCCDYGMAYCR